MTKIDPMTAIKNSSEFRFCYSTPLYTETVSFYKDKLRLEVFRSWDRGNHQQGQFSDRPLSYPLHLKAPQRLQTIIPVRGGDQCKKETGRDHLLRHLEQKG